MLFLQPVPVHDAFAADRSVAAEVRTVERNVAQPRWSGVMVAENPADQRSPFGNNAPDHNDSSPNFAPPNPPSSEPPPDRGKSPVTDPSSKKVPPAPVRPDAGPPP